MREQPIRFGGRRRIRSLGTFAERVNHEKGVIALAITIVFFDLGETLVTTERRWLPGAQELLRGLRRSGLRLGIISNTRGLTTRTAILELLPADFDPHAFEENLTLFSSEVGKEKPHQAIFNEAIKRSGEPADRCLYCSEDIVETLMAQQVGMRSIRVQTHPNSDLSGLQQSISDFHLLLGE
jgi:FMN phosphatase YigB (HAD superfamily)